MKVAEAVEHMTKQYLQRVIDSFTRDFPRLSIERARETILQNVDELSDPDRIKRRLSFKENSFSERIIQRHILEELLNDSDRKAGEETIVRRGQESERAVLAEADDPDSLRYQDAHSVEILEAVLSVAVEDERISEDELDLIVRLRRKLSLSEKTQRVVLARLEHYPRSGNEIHSAADFRDALNDLQRRGVLFYCNRLDGGTYVIPDEILPGVKEALGVELNDRAYQLLLENLTKQQLAKTLEKSGLPKSGSKDTLIERVIAAGILPSETLGLLKNTELYELCKSLPGANVSGTKDEKIERIVDYFDNLVIKDIGEEAAPEERYYEYFVELAHRDRENLLANDIIRKDLDMNAAFEEGARFLFREKLGLDQIDEPGSDHADGCLEFSSGGDLLLWDTKSKESLYSLPGSHVRQFKRYIRDSKRRVSCFLIIAPEIHDEAEIKAARLKADSRTDTDVALIAAEDLKWLAEGWAESSSPPLNIEVFNITGILDRKTLERRVELFG